MGKFNKRKKNAGAKSRGCQSNHFSDFMKTNEIEIGNFSSSDSENNQETEDNRQPSKSKKFKSFERSICQFRQLSTIDDELSSSSKSLHKDSSASDVEIDENFEDSQPATNNKTLNIKEDTSDSESEAEQAVADIRNTKVELLTETEEIIEDVIEGETEDKTQDTINELTPSPNILPNAPQPQYHHSVEESESIDEIIELKEEEEEKQFNESILNSGKKVSKGGLAERLQILQRRQRTDFAFWRHNKNEHDMDRTIQARIVDIKSLFGVVSVTCSLKDDKEFLVLLSSKRSKDLGFAIGSSVIINPPWLSVFVKELQSLVLLNVNKITTIISVHHNCLWTQACQELVGLHEKYLNSDSTTLDFEEETTTVKEVNSSNFLAVEKVSQTNKDVQEAAFSKELTLTGRVQRVFFKKVSRADETSPFVNSLQNKRYQSVEADKDSLQISVSMMLQDVDNKLSLIQKTIDCTEENVIACFCKMEGCIVQVNQLMFAKKVSNRRNAPLKSMMQLFVECEESQVISQQVSQSSSLFHSNQMFVYNFSRENFIPGESLKIVASNEFVFPYMAAKSVCENGERRMSIDVRLLTIIGDNSPQQGSTSNKNDKDDSSLNDVVQLFAIGLGGELIKIQIHDTFFIPVDLKKIIARKDVDFVPVHLKDSLVNGQDGFIADEYSRFFLLLPNQTEDPSKMNFTKTSCSHVLLENLELPFRIPTLQMDCTEGDLIKLTGRICGIDEKTALFWKVCNECESNEIEESTNDQSLCYCEQCQKEVSFRIKVQLDVFFYKSIMPNIHILCKLTDESINKLLPLKDMKNEEFTGFDFRHILGKKLSSRLFYVTSVINNYGRNRTKLFNLKECRTLSCF